MSILSFVNRKAVVAERLSNGEAGGDIIDAYNQVSGVLSGVASFVWPGRVPDKKRFVEAWVQFAGDDLRPAAISLPLLFQWTRDTKKDPAAIEALKRARPAISGLSARLVTGRDVDLSEAEVSTLCPTLTRTEIRKFSYPSVFYTEVRSQVAHEYELTGHAAPFSMYSASSGVNYLNMLPNSSALVSIRHIHFEVTWLVAILRSIGAKVDTFTCPCQPPQKWWLDG